MGDLIEMMWWDKYGVVVDEIIFYIDDFMYSDEHTGDLYCRDCFRRRYLNDFRGNEEGLDRFIATRRYGDL